MKVKIFVLDNEGIQSLENRVNTFLNENNILDILQTESLNEDTFNLTLTVVYQ